MSIHFPVCHEVLQVPREDTMGSVSNRGHFVEKAPRCHDATVSESELAQGGAAPDRSKLTSR